MTIRLLRHATLLVEIAGFRLLVDPMLGDPGVMPPIAGSGDERRNPLVPLPVPAAEAVAGVDGALITHLHRDHLDDAAAELLPRDLPLVCQPPDEGRLRELGFRDVLAVDGAADWRGLRIARTGGRHGTGEIGARMGAVSGFVVSAGGEPSVYVAGDTIWCEEVAGALAAHRPAVVVVNAGEARFAEGDPITMDGDDVVAVCRAAPWARVVAVHMEAINHCRLSRAALAERLRAEGLGARVAIPADGESLPPA
jgi:L-ascorbate metabolism protein UlaG (beta-lactamase superfamily)